MPTLRDLRCCFEGVVPSAIATCAADGTPNVSYISHVHFVDDRHVAISYQFFNTTRRNILANPHAHIRVRDPRTSQPFDLKVRYLRSEFDGPIFDAMNVRLQIIASYEGMSEVFTLKAADIYEVTSVGKVEDYTALDAAVSVSVAGSACVASSVDLEALRVVTEKLARCESLEEALDKSLHLLEQFFGFKHLILLLADESGRVLTTHASRGYPEAGIGSEVAVGEGLIGLVAERRRVFYLTGVESGMRYARTIKERAKASGLDAGCREIALPGLKTPADQLGIPLVSGRRLVGELVAETDRPAMLGPREQNLLSIVANVLAAEIARFRDFAEDGEADRRSQDVTVVAAKAGKTRRLRFSLSDDSIFIDDEYLIKNVPARILWYILKANRDQGRVEFSNRELRAEKWLMLPEIKDNLESRLILLKKRLQEKCPDIALRPVGRGRFRLELGGGLEMVERG